MQAEMYLIFLTEITIKLRGDDNGFAEHFKLIIIFVHFWIMDFF